jgi:hypothetical protein
MRLRTLLAVAALVLGACAHDEPFQPQDTTTDRPFAPGTPTRLTFNPGADLHPAWLPDGSALIYAWQQLDQPDRDRCLGIMAATGGTRTRTICNPDAAALDSADLFDSPSPSDDGQLVYLRASGLPGAKVPAHPGVFLGPLADPLAATELFTLPHPLASGLIIGGISTARWIDSDHFLFVGQSTNYAQQDLHCPLDTLVTGLAIVEMRLAGAGMSADIVPSTDGASSAALTAGRDTLYYTLNGDSRVYRLALATGVVSVAHDFGALGVARDVTVLGARLVAVVGGELEYVPAGPLGPLQVDGGGTLVSVDLSSGEEAPLPVSQPVLFHHPEFAPGVAPVRLVAEAVPVDTTTSICTWHHLASKVGDLYLYESP